MQILYWIILSRQPKSNFTDLPNVWSPLHICVQHILDQLMHTTRVLRVIWYGKLTILDGQRALAKGQSKETELVEHTSECPDIRFGRNAFTTIQIDHFWSTIRKRCVLLYLLLDHTDAMLLRI